MSALDGACKYLNNLLLARGLLTEGQPIDFALSDDVAANTDKTMSKVINLVHDLVIRRDRDAEQHESMASKIKYLQVGEKQHFFDAQRLQDKADLLKSRVTTAEAHEQAARVDLGRVEVQLKALKDQNLKMKSMVDQIRAKCVGDVKRRDTEIAQLRSHIAGLQRGHRTTTHGAGSHLDPQQPWNMRKAQKKAPAPPSSDWTLEHESAEFLKEIVTETTDENVVLRKIIAHGTQSLRDISGMEMTTIDEEEQDGIGIPGQYRKSRQVATAPMPQDNLVPCQTLELNLQRAIEHCRTILRDPSFVPIEEVQLREEEIAKLTAGWEKMADRWKEAVTMMTQWKTKMQNDGNQDISGWSDLSFGRSIAVRPNGEPILGQSDMSSIFDQVDQESPASDTEYDSHEGFVLRTQVSSLTPVAELQSEPEEEPEPEPELEPARKRLATSPAKRGVKLIRTTSRVLSEITSNTSRNTVADDPSLMQEELQESRSPMDQENDTFHHRKNRLKNPKPLNHPSKVTESAPRMTMSQKLVAVEAEAVEARGEQARKSGTKRKGRSDSNTNLRSRQRRRSTLSPEELMSLMNTRS